jgi:hypothetical protein
MIVALYLVGYVIFRATHQETWQQDGATYVIFPTGAGLILYYLWRPVSYVDGAITGMKFHIGPHQ